MPGKNSKVAAYRSDVRIGRLVKALLQKGASKREVAKLLEIEECNLQAWVSIADRELYQT